jgi:hypothetical protein
MVVNMQLKAISGKKSLMKKPNKMTYLRRQVYNTVELRVKISLGKITRSSRLNTMVVGQSARENKVYL